MNIVYGIRLSHDLSFEYRYVGQTSRGESRFAAHISNAFNPKSRDHHTSKYRWIRKHYGNVTFDILEVCESPEDLNLTEMKWIHILKTRGHRLLNNTSGGEGIRGRKHTVESKQLMSQQRKGYRFSDESRAKMSKTRTGMKASEEAKAKLSEIRKLTNHTRWHTNRGLVNPECKHCTS